MPYKDPSMKSQRQRVRRVKPLAEAPEVMKSLNEAPEAVKTQPEAPIMKPLPPEWENVVNFIKRDPKNLGKLQRIAGSLGKYAGEVRLGVYGPTLEEIGRTIGVQPAMY